MERDRTMTPSLLWEEHAMLAARNSERPYSYTRSCELYAAWCDERDTAVTRKYIPGDLGEFDWALPAITGKAQSTCISWAGLRSMCMATLFAMAHFLCLWQNAEYM
jgi:hypothetical protein